MNVKFVFEGMDAFKQALRQLPEDLAHEGGVIVEAQAREAARQIQDAYPQGPTGNLRRGVTTQVEHTKFGVIARIRSRARHSHLFEKGTGLRRTSKGWNRGRMPAGPVQERMVPIVVRRRRIMVDALKGLLRRAGFVVTE